MDSSIIREEYEAGLAIPTIRPPKQLFVGTVGLVGSGKTTVLKPLAEKLGLVRISSDDIRKLLKENGLSYEPLMEIVQPLAESLADKGYSLAFDADCGNPKTKELIENLAKKHSAKIFWIHVNPPEDFILNKLRTYKHTWLFTDGEQAVENYFSQKERRAEENTRFNFFATVDTSKPDVPREIERIAVEIESSDKN